MTQEENRQGRDQSLEKTPEVSESQGEPEEAPYPPFLEYLQSKEGHELASRIFSIIEDIKKATIESSAESHKRDSEYNHKIQRLWLCLQSAVFGTTIVAAALLAWHGKLDATVAALMGTLFGYFLGRPLR
jgi:hypothetical protein